MPAAAPQVATRDKLAELKKKIDRLALLEMKEECQDSLRFFVEKAWSTIDPSPFMSNFAIDAICDHLEALMLGHIPRLLINVPPRCSKTTIVSIMFPAWVWLRYHDIAPLSGPQVRFLCSSYSEKLTLLSSNSFRRLIGSEWYRTLHPNLTFRQDQNTKSHMDNSYGGSRQSTSVGGSLLGLGGDILICLPYDERILTNQGWLKIGDIVTNELDVLVAGVSNSNEVVWQDINKHETNPGKRIIEIKWDFGSLRCTEDHPVFIEGKGYIQAQYIKEGDVLWSIKELHSEDRIQSAKLCGVRSYGVQVPFGEEESQSWGILQYGMSRKSFSWAKQSSLYWKKIQGRVQTNLSKLQEGVLYRFVKEGRTSKVLFAQMCCNLAGKIWKSIWSRKQLEVSIHNLSNLWESVLEGTQKEIILFQNLLQQRSFKKDVRGRQFPLYSWNVECALPSSVQFEIEEFNKREGQQYLRDLQVNLFGREAVCSSSYRLQQRQHRPDEPDDTLQYLPSKDECKETPPAGVSRVAVRSIKRLGYEQTTYNLRVDLCHNYFAEGILVHNCDDLNNTETEKIVETGAERNKANSFFDEFRSTRRNDPREGRFAIINVQQRVHQEDTSGHWLDSEEEVTHLMIPMRHDPARHCVTVKLPQYEDTDPPWEDPRDPEGDDLMWPERFGEFEVRGLEKALGPYAAAGRLQQSPTPKGGAILRREWWKLWDEKIAAEYGLEWSGERREYPHCELVVASLDTALKEKEENDFNALTVWGIFLDKVRNRRAMLMYGWQGRLPLNGVVVSALPNEAPALFERRKKENWGLVQHVHDICKRYKVKRLLIEDKTRGHDVANELKRQYSRENFGVQLLNPVGDKVSRAHAVVPLLTDGAIYAPFTKWSEAILTQAELFPKAAHDDWVDSVTQFLNWARENELLVMSDEMSAANEDAAAFQPRQKAVNDLYGI